MFDSKADNVNWVYVSRQLLRDDFTTNQTIPWMNGCIMFQILAVNNFL